VNVHTQTHRCTEIDARIHTHTHTHLHELRGNISSQLDRAYTCIMNADIQMCTHPPIRTQTHNALTHTHAMRTHTHLHKLSGIKGCRLNTVYICIMYSNTQIPPTACPPYTHTHLRELSGNKGSRFISAYICILSSHTRLNTPPPHPLPLHTHLHELSGNKGSRLNSATSNSALTLHLKHLQYTCSRNLLNICLLPCMHARMLHFYFCRYPYPPS